jgi:hypothetical protein
MGEGGRWGPREQPAAAKKLIDKKTQDDIYNGGEKYNGQRLTEAEFYGALQLPLFLLLGLLVLVVLGVIRRDLARRLRRDPRLLLRRRPGMPRPRRRAGWSTQTGELVKQGARGLQEERANKQPKPEPNPSKRSRLSKE